MSLQGKKYPFSRAYVEITSVCNRSCSFCPGTRRAPRFMTVSEMAHILGELSGLTEYIYLHVMGEPLLHPEIKELISLAASQGFRCAVTTNATLIAERTEELLDSGVYKVNLSVHSFEDGTAEEHKKYISELSDFAEKASKLLEESGNHCENPDCDFLSRNNWSTRGKAFLSFIRR